MAKKQLVPLDLSAVTTGTAPFVLSSTTVVGNLNADLLDGQHGSYYADIPGRLGYTPVNRAGDTMTGKLLVSVNNPALAASSYANSSLELRTSDGSLPILGFHIGAVSAAALYWNGQFRYRDNSNADYAFWTEANFNPNSYVPKSGATMTGPLANASFTSAFDFKTMSGTGAGAWYDGNTTVHRAFVGMESASDSKWRIYSGALGYNLVIVDLPTAAIWFGGNTSNLAGGVGVDTLMHSYGWGDTIPRWKWFLMADASLSLYRYNSAGAYVDRAMNFGAGGAHITGSLAIGANAVIGTPLDVDTSLGRILFRATGGTNSIDSVNLGNSTYIQLNVTSPMVAFSGQVYSAAGDITAAAGDLRSYRASNAAHGIVWLGNTGTRYLYYDGNYVLPGAQLYINGSVAWHGGNLNPANAANFTTGTLSGAVMPAGYNPAGATSIADWNNVLTQGTFMASGASNAPDASGAWFIGNVTVHNTDWVSQELWKFTDTPHSTSRWRRQKFSGTWGAWTRNLVIAGVEFQENSGVYINGTLRLSGADYQLWANASGWVRIPRQFIQSSDPGAAAGEGDTWGW